MNIVIAIIILLGYTIALCIKGGGVPSSLSASVFDLPKGKRWIWTVVLYAVCILVLFPFGLPYGVSFLDKVSENTQFLAFIAMVGLAFVGAAPLVADKTDMAYKVHCFAAVLCAVSSQLVLVFNQPLFLVFWIPWLFCFVDLWRGKQLSTWTTKVFWAKMVCFGSTFAFCLI